MFMISESQRRNYLLFYIKLAHFKSSMTGFLKDVVITYKSFKRKRNKVKSLLYSKINFFLSFFFFAALHGLQEVSSPTRDLKRILIAREALDVEKPAVFSVAGGSVNWHDPSGRQFGNMYQKSHPLT